MFAASLLALMPVAAFAETTEATAETMQNSPLASFLPLILIFIVFWVVLIKPQQKRANEHKAVLAALKKGDQVITGGGIVGRITKVSDEQVSVEIASGVEVSVMKYSIQGLVGAAKPAAPEKKKNGAPKNVKNDNVVPSRESVANDN